MNVEAFETHKPPFSSLLRSGCFLQSTDSISVQIKMVNFTSVNLANNSKHPLKRCNNSTSFHHPAYKGTMLDPQFLSKYEVSLLLEKKVKKIYEGKKEKIESLLQLPLARFVGSNVSLGR